MFVLILSLICSLLIAIFAIQNAGLVTIQLFWITTDVPLVLVILGSTFAGALVMLLLAIWRELRLKLKAKQALKEENLKTKQTLKEESPNKSLPGSSDETEGKPSDTSN
ncbi:uncharacterized integral membrane protein [Desulfosporosinus orientis DSM 765]|uniref:Uncharacterized integral membrane protein n=1 Tax=Desulfosporosinus orientis (strain ATCC 19365 / DSM 765 / NCIMB 8382 / VKM B-1628 / Singapore I) TaxID=768706 RepID=G7WF40_DESOD|nr:LapA family protein [Desulfosporosinus orientis]AET67651.1 uncharacterized integral membrane protein [Desulfosporosinus orientis DSM 765]